MTSPLNKPSSRRQQFAEEIDRALAASPYRHDPNLDQIYCRYLLRELLIYSAMDLMEVRQRLRELAERNE